MHNQVSQTLEFPVSFTGLSLQGIDFFHESELFGGMFFSHTEQVASEIIETGTLGF